MRRAARIFAMVSKKSMWQLTSSAMRGAKLSIAIPRSSRRRTMYRISTIPSAISSTASSPPSLMV